MLLFTLKGIINQNIQSVLLILEGNIMVQNLNFAQIQFTTESTSI